MGKQITIDPITRLEGHGKINIFLDDKGDVDRVYLQVPELRGFEKFCEGRAVEEMPTLTQKICGVCPTAHHTAASKALDHLFGVEPPPAARKIRELLYNAFIFEDHLLHFYFLGGPDLIVGPVAPGAERNIFGVIKKVGDETGKKVIDVRNRVRKVMATLSGSPLYPVCGLPGGVSKSVSEEERTEIQAVAKDAVELAKATLEIFRDVVLKNKAYTKLLYGDLFSHKTYYMGLVDDRDRLNFYDGMVRVVDPEGKEFARFEAKDYLKHLEERVDPLSYQKILYLKNVGWKGFVDGKESGIYRVGPLARLNAAECMTTDSAQVEFEKMFDAFGKKPVHNTFAYHWARLVEALNAAEMMYELSSDQELTDTKIRNIPTQIPREGMGVCEAPRGTLFHHYKTNSDAIVEELNLLVATQNSAAAISMSVEQAARILIKGGKVSDGKLNIVEMAFRAYDPCLACATHCLDGKSSTISNLCDKDAFEALPQTDESSKKAIHCLRRSDAGCRQLV
ncbi:MAG: Ni/Fe hydrogenase subunit alpha [Deltaproteobacteria bacterium]|nr:Ni/Fe hydrogenase subunit alpha [Deltaproteobacteria bacterium]MBW2264880.1 Ni/Fe hydrogenase subunit alpha [Deltaproteobacteria bacterium]MBW2317135.1 Ni/Fe hydrogenase subunit alpha [Deltaproteobacteria bacterium]